MPRVSSRRAITPLTAPDCQRKPQRERKGTAHGVALVCETNEDFPSGEYPCLSSLSPNAHNRNMLALTHENQTAPLTPRTLCPGDVLLIRGHGIWSRLVGVIEGTDFDHVAIVAPPNFDDPVFGRGGMDDRTEEAWMFDVSFGGGRWVPLSSYEDQVRSIRVRRHRLGLDESVVEHLKSTALSTEEYSWERLLTLSLLAVTRWAPQLNEVSPRVAGAFLQGLLEVMARMRMEAAAGPKTRRLCSDLIVDGFHVVGATSADGRPSSYFGLVVPPTRGHGLLSWAASMQDFDQFVASQPLARRPLVLDTDMAADPGPAALSALLHEAAIHAGVSFAGMRDMEEDYLRELVIDGARFALSQLLGQVLIGESKAVTDPRRSAWYLLDQLLRGRYVPTPRDIGETCSLFDAGPLDLDSVSFRRGVRVQ